jgi:hypothetical protein
MTSVVVMDRHGTLQLPGPNLVIGSPSHIDDYGTVPDQQKLYSDGQRSRTKNSEPKRGNTFKNHGVDPRAGVSCETGSKARGACLQGRGERRSLVGA